MEQIAPATTETPTVLYAYVDTWNLDCKLNDQLIKVLVLSQCYLRPRER